MVDKKLYIISGEGGHFDQACALSLLISEKNLVIFSDDNRANSPDIGVETITLPKLNEHTKYLSFSSIITAFYNFMRIFRVALIHVSSEKCRGVVSFGPLICIPFAIVGRVRGVRICHIETRSRFFSRSRTGQLMYRLANRFYVQNPSLTDLYPRSVYCGRL